MTAKRYVLALDQGTPGSTALVVDAEGEVRGRGYALLPQYFPRPGWVEHDPEEIWKTTEQAARQALRSALYAGWRRAVERARGWATSCPGLR